MITPVMGVRGRIARVWVAFRKFDLQIAENMNRTFMPPPRFPFPVLTLARWLSYVLWLALICGLIYLVVHGAESLIS